jgi:hypothetical protein
MLRRPAVAITKDFMDPNAYLLLLQTIRIGFYEVLLLRKNHSSQQDPPYILAVGFVK